MKNFHQKPVTFVGEVSINVLDIDKAITFYQDIIGLQVLKKNERQAVLTTDGKTPLLTLEQPADVIPKEGRDDGLISLCPFTADPCRLINFLTTFTSNEISIWSGGS